MNASELLETVMIVCFGVSWPLSIYRSVKARSTKGKSLPFMCCIAVGYVCGILSKILASNFNLAFWFYLPNVCMVSADILLYLRNRRVERAQNDEEESV